VRKSSQIEATTATTKTKNHNEKMNAESKYKIKAAELNAKYPALKAEVKKGWGDRLEIEVSTIDKAKACSEMFREFTFVSGNYR
jgi:hypothetical protein